MLFRLLVLFVGGPLVEIAVLLWLKDQMGWGATIALVLVTGIIGASLAQREGLRTMARIQAGMARGELPTGELVEAVLILAAGLVLITPGVLTDILGFALLVRPVRSRVGAVLMAYFAKRVVMVSFDGAPVDESIAGAGPIVDVEATSVDVPDDKPDTNPSATFDRPDRE